MNKKILLSLFLLQSLISGAQRIIDVTSGNINAAGMMYTVGGQPLSTAKYTSLVEGDPYFYPNWMKGALLLEDSTSYVNLLLRVDLITNEIEYQDKNGQTMIAPSSVREVTLTDSLGQAFRFAHSSGIIADNKTAGWYQVLETGKASIYKYFKKELSETKPYGSATTEQRISTNTSYFLLTGKSLVRIKKLKDIPDQLADKKNELSAYISSQKLSGKSDRDYADLIRFYNQ